jgi:sulfate adenylyltransferase subunit 2
MSPSPDTSSVDQTNARRRLAVQLRQQGVKLAEAARQAGLSAPTVVAAFKAWKAGGWDAVDTRPRGRKPSGSQALTPGEEDGWIQRWLQPGQGLWSLARCMGEMRATHPAAAALADTQLEPLVQRLWQRANLVATSAWDVWRQCDDPALVDWHQGELHALRQLAREADASLLALNERSLPGGRQAQLAAHTGRGSAQWQVTPGWPTEADWLSFWRALHAQAGRPVWLLSDNAWLGRRPALAAFLAEHTDAVRLIHLGSPHQRGPRKPESFENSAATPAPAA